MIANPYELPVILEESPGDLITNQSVDDSPAKIDESTPTIKEKSANKDWSNPFCNKGDETKLREQDVKLLANKRKT